jgi:hypothetical protein
MKPDSLVPERLEDLVVGHTPPGFGPATGIGGEQDGP